MKVFVRWDYVSEDRIDERVQKWTNTEKDFVTLLANAQGDCSKWVSHGHKQVWLEERLTPRLMQRHIMEHMRNRERP